MISRALSVLLVIALLVPISVYAQEGDATTAAAGDTATSATLDYSGTYAFQRQGVFGCSLNGSYAMSVGALSAVGGVFVPVNDAAVTLNTGYLVYKECVLRGIVNRMRENATAGYAKQITNFYTAGRGGLAQFSQSLPKERTTSYTQSVVGYLKSGQLNTLDPAIRDPILRTIAQGYQSTLNRPTQNIACPYANLAGTLQGRPDNIWTTGLPALMTPGCDPVIAYTLANEATLGYAASTWDDTLTRLGWDNGNYPIMGVDEDGNPLVLTPGSIVGANALQALQTGFKQLENANDIDQMVGALFAGITSQIVSDNRGLIGLTQKTGSQASYLDQVVTEASQGLRNSVGNAGIQILIAAKQIEQGFLSTMQAVAQKLVETITNLRAKENACWNLIIQSVCANALSSSNTCQAKTFGCTDESQNAGGTTVNNTNTCASGITLKVATTTQFSQAVIDARVRNLASSTQTNIDSSSKALALIQQLLDGVTNTNSLNAQRVALQQLDNLVAQKSLHNQYDLQNAQDTKTRIEASMDTLITDTAQAWGDGQDPNVSWCNVNNQAVLDMWVQRWKQ